MPKTEIVRRREPQVSRALDNAYAGELSSQYVDAALGRSVIDDNHFERDARGVLLDAAKAVPQVFHGVPVYGNNGDVHFARREAYRQIVSRPVSRASCWVRRYRMSMGSSTCRIPSK